MTSTTPQRRAAAVTCVLAFALLSGCGGSKDAAYDWRNRDLAWKYGPTHGTATREHLLGTGTLRGEAMAEGWRCELVEGKQLSIRPFRLADEHELFGEACLVVSLFDRQEEEITTLRTTAVNQGAATFSLDLDEATARAVCDLILYYGKP